MNRDIEELEKPDIVVLLGPTAVGKTHLAARLANAINRQIISADSRQVYREMNLGTGKDPEDYIVNGKIVPVHLIDIVDPGYEYSLFEFVHDFNQSYQNILASGSTPLLCGGTGLYLDAVIRSYLLNEAKPDAGFRSELESKTDQELIEMLSGMRLLHNRTDIEDRNRLIRAIEIARRENKITSDIPPLTIKSLVFGLRFNRSTIRERITTRLRQRLQSGMTDEVRNLIASGISPEKLMFYGLEYKYITLFVTGKISFDEMFIQLNTAIHQFAKRQMTWFRRMERNGVNIYWLEGEDGEDANLGHMLEMSTKAGIRIL